MATLAYQLSHTGPIAHETARNHDTILLNEFKKAMLAELLWIFPKELKSYRQSVAESLAEHCVTEIKTAHNDEGFAAFLSNLENDENRLNTVCDVVRRSCTGY